MRQAGSTTDAIPLDASRASLQRVTRGLSVRCVKARRITMIRVTRYRDARIASSRMASVPKPAIRVTRCRDARSVRPSPNQRDDAVTFVRQRTLRPSVPTKGYSSRFDTTEYSTTCLTPSVYCGYLKVKRLPKGNWEVLSKEQRLRISLA